MIPIAAYMGMIIITFVGVLFIGNIVNFLYYIYKVNRNEKRWEMYEKNKVSRRKTYFNTDQDIAKVAKEANKYADKRKVNVYNR